MKDEISAAASWWADHLKKALLHHMPVNEANEQAEQFKLSLFSDLSERFTAHWYEESPLRGSAYRCISYDHRMDSVLKRAGGAIGMDGMKLEKYLLQSGCRNVIMFINPHDVHIVNAITNETREYVYRKHGQYLAGTSAKSFHPYGSPHSHHHGHHHQDIYTAETHAAQAALANGNGSIHFNGNGNGNNHSNSSSTVSSPDLNGSGLFVEQSLSPILSGLNSPLSPTPMQTIADESKGNSRSQSPELNGLDASSTAIAAAAAAAAVSL